jgi:VWFA-related protein
MRNTANARAAVAFALAAGAGLLSFAEARPAPLGAEALAQAAPAAPQAAPQQPTFRVAVDLVTTDVIVRDQRDQFVSDLKPDEFEVYEDGVKQNIVSLVLTHGGRVFNVQAPPPAAAPEGIILPPARPTNDAAGRVFLIFIDDLHLDFRMTPRARDLMQRMLRNLVHDGDMFGIVSTGTSSISEQLTYDRQVLEGAISRVTGSGLRPEDVMRGMQGNQASELRYRAHVAFKTAYDLMRNLESLRNRRKAVIYISSGYDFNPFETSRLKYQAEMYGLDTNEAQYDPFTASRNSGNTFAEADLVRELAELTRAANRANATFYTIDPRGLIAGQDLGDEQVDSAEWQNHIRETQDSLRVLAEQTGGIAVVNQNDFDKALKRIDAETSDYYVLGYYSTNPDPLKRTRRIEVKTVRDGVQVWSRTSYSLRPTPPPQ